jgi:hypothetical protein
LNNDLTTSNNIIISLISLDLAEKRLTADLIEINRALLVKAVDDKIFAFVIGVRSMDDLQLIEHEKLLTRFPMIGLIFLEWLSAITEEVDENSQTPKRNRMLFSFFFRREVEVVIFVDNMLEVIEEKVVEVNVAQLQFP